MKNMTEFERREADCECPLYKSYRIQYIVYQKDQAEKEVDSWEKRHDYRW